MKMYQASTLQALMLGYSRTVISVNELLDHGETLESIRDLLGHSDIRTTSEYIVDTRAIEERGKRRQRILGANDLILSNDCKPLILLRKTLAGSIPHFVQDNPHFTA